MQNHDIESKRNNFALACTIIVGAITFVCLFTSFSLFLKCFADWPKIMQYALSFATAGAIEITACALTWGLTNALATGTERAIAGVGLAVVVGVMAINLVTHTMTVRKIPLAPWQTSYINYVGPGVIIGALVILLALLLFRPEVKEAFHQRNLYARAKTRIAEWQQKVVESDEFEDYLEANFKETVFDQAVRRAGLPPRGRQALSTGGQQGQIVEGELISEKPAQSKPGAVHTSHGPVFLSQNGGQDWAKAGEASPDWDGPTGPPRPKK